MENLNALERMALGTIQANATNGSSWAVVTDAELIRGYSETIKENANSIKLYQLKPFGALIEVPAKVFADILYKIDGEALATFKTNYKENREQAIDTFKKVVHRMIKNVQKEGRVKEIGIYSINSEQYATKENDERVRAFQLNFQDLGTLLNEISNETGVNFTIALSNNAQVSPQSLLNIPNFTALEGIQTTKRHNAILVKLIIN